MWRDPVMNAGSWKFIAGVVLGLAGGFTLRPVVMTDRGDSESVTEQGASEASSAESEALGGKSGARRSGKRSAGSPLARLSSGDAVKDVQDLIASFHGIQSEAQLNPMEMIRRIYLLTQLREDEVVDVLAELSKVDGSPGDAQFGMIASLIALTRLAELNGPEAIRLLHSGPGSMWEGSEGEAAVLVMNSWVAADPDGTKRWFDDGMKPLDPGEMKDLMENDDFRQAYYDGMAKHDAETLSREVEQESDPDKRDEVLLALVRNARDPAEMVGLLDRCAGASDARAEAIEKLCKADPLAAAAWVEGQDADEARDEDVATVASVMMERDSEQGIQWYLAQELSDGQRPGSRLSRIVDHLAGVDLEKAAEWVESRPDDAARDSAEISMARHAMRRNADQGMGWLARVGDPASRDSALHDILRNEWDYTEGRLREGLVEAAEKAGLGDAARNFKPE